MAFLSYGQPILSPVVPFVFGVPPLADYGLFSVEGFIPAHSQGFAVNLQTGPSVNPRDDVALHMGFGTPTGAGVDMTLNSIQSNSWGQPVKFASCPLRKVDPFQIMILVQRRSFMIAFNNQHFCEFHHRMDPSSICCIAVDGAVVVNRVLLEFPGGLPPASSVPSGPQPTYPPYGSQSQMPSGQANFLPGYGFGIWNGF